MTSRASVSFDSNSKCHGSGHQGTPEKYCPNRDGKSYNFNINFHDADCRYSNNVAYGWGEFKKLSIREDRAFFHRCFLLLPSSADVKDPPLAMTMVLRPLPTVPTNASEPLMQALSQEAHSVVFAVACRMQVCWTPERKLMLAIYQHQPKGKRFHPWFPPKRQVSWRSATMEMAVE